MANTPIPPNPARDKIAASTSRHTSIDGAAPQQAQRFSAEMRALMAKQAAERVELETQQWNDRVDVQERHAAEIAALRAKETPAAPAAPPAGPA